MDFRRRFTLFKLLQMVFGLITFGLFMNYNGSLAVLAGADSTNEAFVRTHLTSIAISGYPFVIILITIVAYLINNQTGENSLLHFLFSIAGFGVYLITASLLLHFCSSYNASGGIETTTVFTWITTIIYLVEVVLVARDRCT